MSYGLMVTAPDVIRAEYRIWFTGGEDLRIVFITEKENDAYNLHQAIGWGPRLCKSVMTASIKSWCRLNDNFVPFLSALSSFIKHNYGVDLAIYYSGDMSPAMLDKLERYGIDCIPADAGKFNISIIPAGPSVGDVARGAFSHLTPQWMNPLTVNHRNILLRLMAPNNGFEARGANRGDMINDFWRYGQMNIEPVGAQSCVSFWLAKIADSLPPEVDHSTWKFEVCNDV